jgi:hypothetical protein
MNVHWWSSVLLTGCLGLWSIAPAGHAAEVEHMNAGSVIPEGPLFSAAVRVASAWTTS